VKANDQIPFDTLRGVVPFSYLIECKEVTQNIRYHISALLEQLSVTLLGGDEVEVKAVLAFHCFFREFQLCRMIQDVEIKEFPKNENAKMPGVIGYIVKAKDDLWSLAKKYRTTKESIMEVNELEDENLKVGERILIFRENVSIL
jgi:LysM repeat protein